MSDLCMSELEDIVWEEFGQSDDHIVPHPGDEHGNENAFQGDSRKKPRREIVGVSSNTSDWYAARFVGQGKEEGDFPTLKSRRHKMLENDSWSHTPEGVFPASCDSDSIKEEPSLASDNLRMSSHCFKSNKIDSISSEFCADDPIAGDRCAAVDGNSYRYPLGHISQTDNDLSFLDNDCEDKESSDLLYYGWPDIGNFEDVDRMFRSCDSTFGLGGVDNEDELGCYKSSSQTQDAKPALGHLSFMNASNTISESKDNFTPKGQEVQFNGDIQFKISTINQSKNDYNAMINLHKKQSKQHNQSEGKRKGRCLENGGSFHHISDLQFKDTHIPYMHSDYQHPSDQIPVSPTLSGIVSEKNGLTSLSPKESSYASNQVQSMESSRNHSFEAPAITMDEKSEKLHLRQGFQPSFQTNRERVDLVVPTAIFNPVSFRKQVHQSENNVENHSEVGVCMGIAAELDSSNVQESSSMSSRLDEISLEATSFHQLQHVMEQLDIRTKLCIRDRTNKCTGFMDMETNTNPIDRSIAHLLFHRPPDSSVMPSYDALSGKSHTMIHGSITSPPVMTEKMVCQEETAT
ncbi:hypothetical protein F0562_028946 [Nyssa sinensis]|uniref:Protein LNK1 n=1 Tax=Nyssa sinensis TaxID=561372 RepID=A0A5J5B1J2_9ASTE|nr:hypothetical protein F0562_028946 [Nyssa sinensis]